MVLTYPGRPLGEGDPRRIGRYAVRSVLGAGGQGVVYFAEGPQGDKVAVKLLHAHIAREPDFQRRFLREAQIMREVATFCTARVLEVGVHDDRPYLASEYVAGISLQELLRTQGPCSESSLHRLAVSTLTALAAIHRAGIVHRDFKPANVILGPEGPVVIDFGIARVLEQTTTHSGIMGTPAYMAPEQFTAGATSTASDIFSWAVTMAYAASRRLPFDGSTPPAVMHAILTREPDLTGVPPSLATVLAACLDKDPGRRPSAEELLRHFTGLDTTAVSATRVRRTRPAPFLLAAFAQVAVFAGTWALAYTDFNSPPVYPWAPILWIPSGLWLLLGAVLLAIRVTRRNDAAGPAAHRTGGHERR